MKNMLAFLAIGLFVLCHSTIKPEDLLQQSSPIPINQDEPTIQELSASESAETLAHLFIANLTSLLVTMFGIMATSQENLCGQILLSIGLPGWLSSAYALHKIRRHIEHEQEEQKRKIEDNFNNLIGHEPNY